VHPQGHPPQVRASDRARVPSRRRARPAREPPRRSARRAPRRSSRRPPSAAAAAARDAFARDPIPAFSTRASPASPAPSSLPAPPFPFPPSPSSREPKKKFKGQGKTYYHVKDIDFLAHEPLLEKFRALRAYERKIKRAKAKKAHHAVDRLEQKKPTYGLDHLVKERYPSFVDAVRDLDDPLTLVHLFALLPADKRRGIPAEVVHRARALALEFQSYVTKTKSLKKCFISVKGIYYQATIHGQDVTWLTPHQLSQTLPEDVDYRVMLTFLEFYLSMVGFVNYKLYYDRGMRYPPVLDARLEDAAGGIVAVVHDIADRIAGEKAGSLGVAGGAKGRSKQAEATKARAATLGDALKRLEDVDVDEEAQAEEERRRAKKDKDGSDDEEGEEEHEVDARGAPPRDDDGYGSDSDERRQLDAIAESAGVDPATREDAKLRASLFRGLVFFIQRECPRDMMVFLVRSFGGEVCWGGEGSPYDERDGGVTHHVCDRPMDEASLDPRREYVQPQWVVDCANWRVLIPPAAYFPGKPPPPHLSPFVDAEEEGYTPDYQVALRRMQAQAKAAREGRTLAEVGDGDGDAGARLLTEEEQAAEEEKQYARELDREARGIPYSRSAQEGEESSEEEAEEEEEEEEEASAEDDDEDESEDDDEDESEDDDSGSDASDDEDEGTADLDDEPVGGGAQKKRKASRLTQDMAVREKDKIVHARIREMGEKMGEDAEAEAMRYAMLPRKKRELYKAMQIGLAKKEQRASELEARKNKLKAEGKYGHEKSEKSEEEKPKRAAEGNKKARAKR